MNTAIFPVVLALLTCLLSSAGGAPTPNGTLSTLRAYSFDLPDHPINVHHLHLTTLHASSWKKLPRLTTNPSHLSMTFRTTSWKKQSMPTGVGNGHWKPTLLKRRCAIGYRKFCKYNCTWKNVKKIPCTLLVRQPKMCQRHIIENYPCPGYTTTCTKRALEAHTCYRPFHGEISCSTKIKKNVCEEKTVEISGCPPDPCKAWREERCSDSVQLVKEPCSTSGTCEQCIGNLLLTECKREVMHKVSVTCPSTGTTEDSEGTVLVAKHQPMFKDVSSYTEVVRCYFAVFLEQECHNMPPFCDLFDRIFDMKLCEAAVCNDCRRLKWMPVSEKLAMKCEEMLRSKCKTYGSIRMVMGNEEITYAHPIRTKDFKRDLKTRVRTVGSSIIREGGQCYKIEKRKVTTSCPKDLPNGYICHNGCSRKICERQKEVQMSENECLARLPQQCRSKPSCVRKTGTRRVCGEKEVMKVCKFDVQQPYACEKRTGPLDCENVKNTKWCHRSIQQSYMCGHVSKRVRGTCSETECAFRAWALETSWNEASSSTPADFHEIVWFFCMYYDVYIVYFFKALKRQYFVRNRLHCPCIVLLNTFTSLKVFTLVLFLKKDGLIYKKFRDDR